MMVIPAIQGFVSSLVHPSATRDEMAFARHRTFIVSHLVTGMIGVALLPLYLVFRGVPSPLEIMAFFWLITPALIALDLSRNGKLKRAHLLSACCLTGFITTVSAASGGIASFAMLWLAVVPIEAGFSGSRRAITTAVLLCLASILTLLMLEAYSLLPVFDNRGLFPYALVISSLAALGYAAGLALRGENLLRKAIRVKQKDESRYRMLAEHMTDLLTCHTRNGNVIFASPATESLLGISADTLAGKGFFERVHVADRPAFLRAISDTAQSGRTTSVEFRLRRNRQDETATRNEQFSPPMEFVWVEMRCNPAETETTNGYDIIAVTRDISARKQQESELMEAREDADRASAAKTRFLASVSHELRTPLNAIIGFSEILANEQLANVDAERRHEYANLIHDSGHHLLSVVNGILDMSKIESGNFHILPEPFALPPLVSSCVQLFALKAESAGVQLDAYIPENFPELIADKRACKQILINLLSNAIKFTPAKGTVSVYAQVQDGFIKLVVADTGIGIAEEDLPRLGDPFFQAGTSYDRLYEGTGLGLSVVKGLVALHRGELKIESCRGEGTKIAICLPLVHEDNFRKPVPMPENMVTMTPKTEVAREKDPMAMTSVNVSQSRNTVKLRA